MKFENLKQSPFNTTLLGVLRGVADHFRIEASERNPLWRLRARLRHQYPRAIVSEWPLLLGGWIP